MTTPVSPSAAQGIGRTATDVGNIFGKGGTDGLILYALIIGTFLMFLAFLYSQWSASRERVQLSKEREAKDKVLADLTTDFSAASKETAEALKTLATAVASAASSDMTHKAMMAHRLESFAQLVDRYGHAPPGTEP